MAMARTQTMVQLTDDLIRLLDEEASRRNVSRSAVIRAAIEAFLAGGREAELTRQIVDGYRRLPPATPDEWADLDALGDRHTVETMQRLDDEERRAGTGW